MNMLGPGPQKEMALIQRSVHLVLFCNGWVQIWLTEWRCSIRAHSNGTPSLEPHHTSGLLESLTFASCWTFAQCLLLQSAGDPWCAPCPVLPVRCLSVRRWVYEMWCNACVRACVCVWLCARGGDPPPAWDAPPVRCMQSTTTHSASIP